MPYKKYIFPYRYLYLLLILFFTSCKKSNSQPASQSLPAAQGTPIQLQVNLSAPGNAVPDNFMGLSFEMTAITDSTYFNTDNTAFIQLIKNLGNGILRIGANGVDKTFWCGHVINSATGRDSIATTDIDRFSNFINAVGWKVIFGLNLGGNFNPATATNESGYLYNKMAAKIQSLEVGNEVDLYAHNGYRTGSYSSGDFENEWNQYYQSIHSSYPTIAFSGPVVAYNKTWLSSFANTEGSKVNMLTIHYYQGGPGTDPSINLNTLLSQHADSVITTFSNAIAAIASTAKLPLRVAECNSIYGGGKSGVSNSFGSGLWAIDYMWRLAYSGCRGFNFHGGGNGPYSPIGKTNGSFFAKPEYYSMLFFKDGSNGNVLPVSLRTSGLNVSGYACKGRDGNIYVSIVNKESQTPVAVSIQSGVPAHTITLETLTAPSAEATSDINIAGKTINNNGSITTSTLPVYTVQSSNFLVNVPSSSAMLVIIHP
ncbi:MAG: glycosyl hydrolase family protein [Ginsengibacter sp.]